MILIHLDVLRKMNMEKENVKKYLLLLFIKSVEIYLIYLTIY